MTKKAKDLVPKQRKARVSTAPKLMNGDPVLGRKLKSARMRYNLPLQTVTEETGISQAALSALESGSSMPKLDTAATLAYFYDVSLDGLCAHMKNEE